MLKLDKTRAAPFILTAVVFAIDQITKAIIVAKVPLYPQGGAAFSAFGDFFRIIHVRNLGALFSHGANWGQTARALLLIAVPLAALLVLCLYLLLTPQQWAALLKKPIQAEEFTANQRWALALAIGGGFGNIFDRIFRPDGVVDFLDVKFYGLFGMERWPTFNVADMAVVIAVIWLAISFIVENGKKRRHES